MASSLVLKKLAPAKKILPRNLPIYRPPPKLRLYCSRSLDYDPISRRCEITSKRVDRGFIDSDDSTTFWIVFPGMSKDEVKVIVEPGKVCVNFVEAKNSLYKKFFGDLPPTLKLSMSSEYFKIKEMKAEMKHGLLQLTFPKA